MPKRRTDLFRTMTAALVAAMLIFGSGPIAAQDVNREAAAEPTMPLEDALDDWLDAINSGNPARIKAFYLQHADDPNPVFALEQAEDSCGFAVDHFTMKTSATLEVLLRQKCLPGLQRLKLALAEPGNSKLKTIDLRPIPMPDNGAVQTVHCPSSEHSAQIAALISGVWASSGVGF